ncbi:hypothetical protein GCM10027456_69140 [Kineosporia babensis]
MFLVGAWGGVVSAFVGLARFRPSERVAWYLVIAMLLLFSTGKLIGVAQPQLSVLADGLTFVAQSCVLGVVLRLVVIRRRQMQRSATPPDEGFSAVGEQGRSIFRYADLLLLIGICALVVAQTLATSLTLPAGVSMAERLVPVGNVVLVCFMVRFLLSRARLPRATVLGLLAGIMIVCSDVMTVVGAAQGSVLLERGAGAILAVAMWLFVWAPREPSMTEAFDVVSLLQSRSESARLVALMPLAGVPVVLYVLGQQGHGRLPALIYVSVGVVMALVALARGASAVRFNEWQAERDWYTGLLNRRGLVSAMRRIEPSPQQPWQLAMIDIDDFKHVNDTFGHEAGDDLLVQVADRLRQESQDGAIIGRFGGDEFVLVLPVGHACAAELTDRAFAAPFTVAGHEMPVRASAGVTVLESSDRDESQTFTEVDIAVYAAKAAGKNTVVTYDPKHREQILGRQNLITDLRRTLQGDRAAGTFEVHYQPLVELGTGLISGCEALIRWRHAERGMIRPDHFIGLAETSGLAGEIDRWVLLEALHQVARWEAEGIGSIYVSVNLGRTSMLDPALADATLEALRVTGVEPSQLHLEITEHDELPREAGALTLALLTEAGVRVSLDDFGIGYTSLDYLHRYPVRQLKLDRSITSNLQTAPSSPLLEGIVAMAKSLQVDVVAEGIETEPQRERLADLGIAYGQGYHLCRPQPAEAMTSLLREAGPARLIPGQRAEGTQTVIDLSS